MVSEYGQLETIIRRTGTYQITSSPTLTDLNPGDIVLNNSKTLALLRSKRRAASFGVKNLSLAGLHFPIGDVIETGELESVKNDGRVGLGNDHP